MTYERHHAFKEERIKASLGFTYRSGNHEEASRAATSVAKGEHDVLDFERCRQLHVG